MLTCARPEGAFRTSRYRTFPLPALERKLTFDDSEALNALSDVGPSQVLDRFRAFEKLSVRQRKRWFEILFSFEMRNAYDVFDQHQRPVLRVQEVGGGFLALLARLFLGPMRPFRADVLEPDTGEVWLRIRRPWRFIFHRIEIKAGNDEALGAVQKRWSWLRRIYSIEDATGREVATLFGPILKPWTFEIRQDGSSVGVIAKRWSGLGKELFTDADNFGIDVREIGEPAVRALAFAATVLVDVVHFERAKR